MAESICVHYDNGDFRVGFAGSLVIGVWPGAALPEHLDHFRKAELRALEHAGALHLVIGLKLRGGSIDPEIRARGEALQREFKDKLIGQAMILAGSGLVAATMRAFASGLNILSRAKVPTKSFGFPGDAVKWLASIRDQPADLAETLAEREREVIEFTRDLYG
jgi:hypothetical protein